MSFWDGLFGRRDAKLSMTRDFVVERSAAGKTVTPYSALQLSTAWACVRLLSETIGTLPAEMFQKSATGAPSLAPNHALYGLLHDSPNADMSAAEFWEAIAACLCLWGNGYAQKHYGAAGRITVLEFLRPDLMKVYRDLQGVRRYTYSDPFGPARDIPEADMFHVRGFGVGGTMGLAPISYARQTLGTAMAADETAAKMFANGMQQPLFIDSGQARLTKDQRSDLRELFSKFVGADNAGKVMVLEQGMKPVPLSFNPDDAQLLETRQFHVEEICRWFRVPPFMIGHTEKSTSWGTGLEQQMIGFSNFSLRPYLHRIEQAVAKQLLSPSDRKTYFLRFDQDELLRGDSAARAALYSAFGQNGIATRDEMRAKEHLPPKPGGDILTVQSNLVPLEKLGETPPTETPPGFGIPVPKPPEAPPPAPVQPPKPAKPKPAKAA